MWPSPKPLLNCSCFDSQNKLVTRNTLLQSHNLNYFSCKQKEPRIWMHIAVGIPIHAYHLTYQSWERIYICLIKVASPCRRSQMHAAGYALQCCAVRKVCDSMNERAKCAQGRPAPKICLEVWFMCLPSCEPCLHPFTPYKSLPIFIFHYSKFGRLMRSATAVNSFPKGLRAFMTHSSSLLHPSSK